MRTNTIIAHSIVLGLLATPALALAAGLVPCGGIDIATNQPEPDCDFNYLIVMVNGLVQFIFKLGIAITALGFMWAGASLVLQQDKAHAWDEAKERFQDIATGFIIIMAAFVVIKFILWSFLKEEQYNFVKFLINL